MNDTKKIKNFTYGGYVRKSSESEDRQVQSIERQKGDLYDIIEKETLILHGEIIEETKSAFSIGRGGFDELIKLTQKGKINAWLCWHANRLSRNALDTGMIIHLMDTKKLDHIRTHSQIYYNTPVDKMMLQIEFAMSKKDSDDKSVFIKSGLNRRYQRGYTSSKAPIGFLNDKFQEQGNRGWLVDKERLKKVGMLFIRFLKGNDSLNSITAYAQNTLVLDTPRTKRRGGIIVGRSTVELILKNPIYAGFFYSKNSDTGEQKLRMVHEDMPRIITKEQHIKVLNIFGDRSTPMKEKHLTPYTGHIMGSDGNKLVADVKLQVICDCGKKFAYRNKDRCPACNIPIVKMKSPKYLSYTYYFNHKRKRKKGLSVKSIEQKKIDALLLDLHKNELEISRPLFLWVKNHLKKLHQNEIKENKKATKLYQNEIKKLETKKERLRTLFVEEAISFEEYRNDISKLDKTLEIKNKQNILSENWYEEMLKLLDMVYHFEDIIKKSDYSSKRDLLRLFCSNLVWNEEKLLINKANWLNIFIKGRKTILSKYPVFEPENNVDLKGLNGVLDINCPVMWSLLDKIRKTLHKR